MTEQEPFDPTPLSDMELAHLDMCRATKNMQLAVGHLEGVDPERQRRIFALLTEAVALRNELAR